MRVPAKNIPASNKNTLMLSFIARKRARRCCRPSGCNINAATASLASKAGGSKKKDTGSNKKMPQSNKNQNNGSNNNGYGMEQKKNPVVAKNKKRDGFQEKTDARCSKFPCRFSIHRSWCCSKIAHPYCSKKIWPGGASCRSIVATSHGCDSSFFPGQIHQIYHGSSVSLLNLSIAAWLERSFTRGRSSSVLLWWFRGEGEKKHGAWRGAAEGRGWSACSRGKYKGG